MKNVAFHILDNDNTVDDPSVAEQLVCEAAAERWHASKRVLITCEDEKQALQLDETLWVEPAENFVPCDLAGEGPRGGASIKIAWPKKHNSSPHDLLINLRVGFADLVTTLTEVIDLVPYEDSSK